MHEDPSNLSVSMDTILDQEKLFDDYMRTYNCLSNVRAAAEPPGSESYNGYTLFLLLELNRPSLSFTSRVSMLALGS